MILYYFRSEVAKHIKPDSYGLVFGFNLFMSLLVISIFTLLFIQGFVAVIGTKNQVCSSKINLFYFHSMWQLFIGVHNYQLFLFTKVCIICFYFLDTYSFFDVHYHVYSVSNYVYKKSEQTNSKLIACRIITYRRFLKKPFINICSKSS